MESGPFRQILEGARQVPRIVTDDMSFATFDQRINYMSAKAAESAASHRGRSAGTQRDEPRKSSLRSLACAYVIIIGCNQYIDSKRAILLINQL